MTIIICLSENNNFIKWIHLSFRIYNIYITCFIASSPKYTYIYFLVFKNYIYIYKHKINWIVFKRNNNKNKKLNY